MEVLLKPGDIFFTRGPGLFSRAIRFFTRSIGEKRSKVNHVGVVVEEGGIQTAVVDQGQEAPVVEAVRFIEGTTGRCLPGQELEAGGNRDHRCRDQPANWQAVWVWQDHSPPFRQTPK